jgi:sodium-dependent phosphate transporter
MKQACVLAGICEFLGAVLVGAKVSGTIKNGIISLSTFRDNAGVQMLGFTCALVASATWLMIATRNSWPVSTTYSIVSALAGVGVALGGPGVVQWGWNGGKGLGTIFAGFGIAPSIAAGFGAIVYLITKYAVLVRKNPIRNALYISPMYFFTVTAVLTMSIVYKGSPSLNLDELPQVTVALAIVLTALVVAILSIVFWLPYVYCKVVRKDYTLRFYHFFYGPLLWKRQPPADAANIVAGHVPDYRVVGRDGETDATVPSAAAQNNASRELTPQGSAELAGEKDVEFDAVPQQPAPRATANLAEVEKEDTTPQIEGLWILPRNLWIILRYKVFGALTKGVNFDVHAAQAGKTGKEAARIAAMHHQVDQYGNETEHLYSFLQVLTACTNSFAHGANDVANAVGPFSAIYYVWSNGVVTPKNTPTPTWILAFGGAMIVIGLATYGYNMMAALGNRLTLMSPSRGFSMEIGAAITVLLASQYGIPVSTTMCITGATAGVGLVSGGPKAVNWRAFGWIFLGWVLTVPVAGTAAGCLTGLFINAPHW